MRSPDLRDVQLTLAHYARLSRKPKRALRAVQRRLRAHRDKHGCETDCGYIDRMRATERRWIGHLDRLQAEALHDAAWPNMRGGDDG